MCIIYILNWLCIGSHHSGMEKKYTYTAVKRLNEQVGELMYYYDGNNN